MIRLLFALVLVSSACSPSSFAVIDAEEGTEFAEGALTTEVSAGTPLTVIRNAWVYGQPSFSATGLERFSVGARLVAAGGPLQNGFVRVVRGDGIGWVFGSKVSAPRARVDGGSEFDAGIGSLDAGTEALDAGSATTAEVQVRVIAANLTSGSRQAYEAPGSRILSALHGDVIALQEFNVGDNQEATLRGWVEQTFGPEFRFVRGSAAGSYLIPNGIVTRLPVLASGEWIDARVSNRTFVWARLDVPGSSELFVVSVHLLTSSELIRGDEASALLGEIRRTMPAGDHLIIAGDFNTTRRDEPCLSTFAVAATPGMPSDGANSNTNSTRAKPYDHVLASPSLQARERPVVQGSRRFDSGLVFDSRTFTPLTDAAPVLFQDSSALNMQHMAVVRVFAF